LWALRGFAPFRRTASRCFYQKRLIHIFVQRSAQTFPKETPMLTLHHLNDSRSQRILWLLEELGTPYEMKRYQRDAKTRLAPPELEAVHPLGKSPVITDGEIKIAESGAIVDYIIRRYGQGNGKAAASRRLSCQATAQRTS
jgi:glutathione S-transferase